MSTAQNTGCKHAHTRPQHTWHVSSPPAPQVVAWRRAVAEPPAPQVVAWRRTVATAAVGGDGGNGGNGGNGVGGCVGGCWHTTSGGPWRRDGVREVHSHLPGPDRWARGVAPARGLWLTAAAKSSWSSSRNSSCCQCRPLCFALPQPAPLTSCNMHIMRRTCTELKHIGARNCTRIALIAFDSPASATIRWFGKGAEGSR